MITREHYSTIIVGCGPAGIMSARAAAARGPVLIVDSMQLPRDKSCGGMLNEYSQRFFAELGREVPKPLFCEPNWIEFRYVDWDRELYRPTTLRFANVVRSDFDEWLCELLPDNVEIAGSTRFLSAEQDAFGVTVRLRDADDAAATPFELSCSYLVGADGPRSQVRRCLPVSQLALYKTVQDYLPLQGEMEPYFDCVYARGIGPDYGYGYLIPKGDMAILGSVFFPESKGVSKLHEKAVQLYATRYPFSTETTKREAWSAIEVRGIDDIVGGYGRVLLAGEAGGIFSPSSGEGISFALNSGTLAGKAIAQAREGLTKLGTHLDDAESAALHAYRASLGPIKRNIARRMRFFPIMNSDTGKWLGKYIPSPILDKFTHMI